MSARELLLSVIGGGIATVLVFVGLPISFLLLVSYRRRQGRKDAK